MEKNTHKVSLESRKNLEICGVTDMGTYNEEEIEIDTVEGFMIITGSELNVLKLDIEEGVCTIMGKIDSISYIEKNDDAKGFFRRIFR